MNDVELVHVLRGSHPEAVHRGVVALVDSAGTLREAYGDAETLVWLRSIAKPFQAALVAELTADSYALTAQELAIMSGSHGGTPEQVAILRGLMERIGVTETDLHCGVSAPLDRKAADQLRQAGMKPTVLNHPCSGKHLGMVAACRAMGWAVEGYEHFDHPLQRLVVDRLADLTDCPKEQIAVALDGCSVPTFGLTLRQVALGYARLGTVENAALASIRAAMRAHPVLMSGHGRMDTALMQVTNGRLLAKDGSEGMVAISLPEAGYGLVIKISDGATRALMPIVTELLARFDFITTEEAAQLRTAYPTSLKIHTGEQAGTLKVVI